MNWLIGENAPYKVIDIYQDIIFYEKLVEFGVLLKSVAFDETVNSNHWKHTHKISFVAEEFLISKCLNKTEISHFVTEQVFPFLSIHILCKFASLRCKILFLAGKCLYEFFSDIILGACILMVHSQAEFYP